MNLIPDFFTRLEAAASVSLDARGTTTVVTASRPCRERPGFGCPHCGEAIRLDAKTVFGSITRNSTLPCCGYVLDERDTLRLLRAARLLRAGASAH